MLIWWKGFQRKNIFANYKTQFNVTEDALPEEDLVVALDLELADFLHRHRHLHLRFRLSAMV